jgi:iron complex outermembrane recepter protein
MHRIGFGPTSSVQRRNAAARSLLKASAALLPPGRGLGCILPVLCLSAVCQAGFGQSVAPATALQETVVVSATRAGVPSSDTLAALPGGVSVVTANDVVSAGSPTLASALGNAPGVIVRQFFGGNDQPRLQIRGSGLQQSPVERGVLILLNGLPINRADGSYSVGLADPQMSDAIEVYRGYMSNRLGATVLGGALNFLSPTGAAAPGVKVMASGGSFGQANIYGQIGGAGNGVDGLLQADFQRRDGFRDYNGSNRTAVNGNVGIDWTNDVTTRFFAGYTDLGFEVAGPLTKDGMKQDPTQSFTGPTVTPSGTAINPGPNVVRDQPRRDTTQYRIGTRTTAVYGPHFFDLVGGYTYSEDTFRFPIASGVRVSNGGDAIGAVRYAYKPDGDASLPLFEAAAQYAAGSADRAYYLNRSGKTGAEFGADDLDAETYSLNAGFNIPLLQGLTLSPAIYYAHARRDNDDVYAAATRPTIAYKPASPAAALPDGSIPAVGSSYARSYEGWSPSLALTYRFWEGQTVFVAGSRSFEPPTHEDLLATYNGTPNSSPGRPAPANPAQAAAAFVTPDLKAQTATTLEGGWRGQGGGFNWDVVSYYSWVSDELLSLRDASGASVGAINAGKTRHFGIELGVGADLTGDLSGHIAYTYQDFRFSNDPARKNNRLAGAPPHLLNAMLSYRLLPDWFVRASVSWSMEKVAVDNMNTLFSDPYAIFGLRTEYKLCDTVSLFGEVQNLFDKTYASSTLITDAARADQAAFQPGDGRAFYAGIKVAF